MGILPYLFLPFIRFGISELNLPKEDNLDMD